MDRIVSVVGHGSTTAVPDTAVVRIAVVQRASALRAAFAAVAEGVGIVTALACDVVEERCISSRDLTVWPFHDDDGRRSGFEARHALEITCPDLDTASVVLEGLAEAVGNRLQIEGVALEVAEPASAMTTARELAYADAVARATHIAGLAGAGLGPVVSMAEGDGGLSGRGAALGAAVKHTVGFAPGDSVINVALQVVWQLEL